MRAQYAYFVTHKMKPMSFDLCFSRKVTKILKNMMKSEDFDKLDPEKLKNEIIPNLLENQKKLEVFY